MRPLEEVIKYAVCSMEMSGFLSPTARRELEEWEAALLIDISDSWTCDSTAEERRELREQLAIIRKLRGAAKGEREEGK